MLSNHLILCSLLLLCPQSFPASGFLFQWVGSLHQVAKILEFQLQHQSFQWLFRADFLQDWLVWSPYSPRNSQESSPIPRFKSICSSVLSLLYGPTLTSIHDHWKNHGFDKMDLCWQSNVSAFNTLSRFVLAFLPRRRHLLISWVQSSSAVILESKKVKSVTFSIVSPSVCHEVMGPDAMIFVFWMLSFKPAFSLSSFTFIKRLFSSSSLSAARVVSSAYLRLLIFFLAVLIPPCDSSSPAFHMMCSAYKLNKQGDNIQPWCTSFSILNQVCFPDDSVVKESACPAEDVGLFPGLGRSPGVGNGNPLNILAWEIPQTEEPGKL